MRNIIVAIITLAMALVFVPKASANDSAVLGFSVTFAADQDLERVKEISTQLASIWREAHSEKENVVYSGESEKIKTAIGQLTNRAASIEPLILELEEIRERRTDLADIIRATIEDCYNIRSYIGVYIKQLKELLAVIAIELYPTNWVLEDVKLGERRNNLNAAGTPVHTVVNTGGKRVLLDIGYGTFSAEGIVPGLEQGLNTFVTEVKRGPLGMSAIPPDSRIRIADLEPDEKVPLHLVYGAPTAVDEDIAQHSGTYEVRAYGSTEAGRFAD